MSIDPDRIMIDPPEGWRYGFPKRIPREHQGRVVEWLIENGYPEELTKEKWFSYRCWREKIPMIETDSETAENERLRAELNRVASRMWKLEKALRTVNDYLSVGKWAMAIETVRKTEHDLRMLPQPPEGEKSDD